MTDHATLKSDIATFMQRDDLTSVIPTIVRLTEDRIADEVRIRQMENRTTLTIDGENGADIPDKFLGLRGLHRNDSTYFELEYLPPNAFWNRSEAHVAGTPFWYTLEAGKIYFAPYFSSTEYAEAVFWKEFDRLSGDQDTNWLLTNRYRVYLYGAQAEAKAFVEDDEQAGKWASAFTNAVQKLNTNNQRAVRGLSTIRVSRVP